MKHLILCREYPPAPYPPGGIGTYVAHISRALAERGEIVHVIGQRWEGADKDVEIQCQGRLIIHRISADDISLYPTLSTSSRTSRAEVKGMLASQFPAQWFSWVAAGLCERLIEREGIDIIEGQEWEAPLFFLMQRRALGLGPERRPPCVVHFHSPTEMIFRHNEWSIARPDYLPMKRYEDYVVRSADGYLCPSNYLAEQCTKHYGLDARDIYIQPYPRGETPIVPRNQDVWSKGSICYFGRLEPRKGIVEWVDAAVSVARQRPTPRFEFIGSDLPYTEELSVKDFVSRRIPDELRERFVFHDSKPRQELIQMLGKACIAAVPSRWENFPNTCIEAMGTGLPVIASRDGGMVEMVQDGVTGWLPSPSNAPLSDQLAEALQRALDVAPSELAVMGNAAAASIRKLCDNDAIVERHKSVRAAIVERGSHRSRSIPSNLPWPEQSVRPKPMPDPGKGNNDDVAVIILALRGESPDLALQSIAGQSLAPSAVVVVSDEKPHGVEQAMPFRFASYHGSSRAVALQRAVEALNGVKVAGWLLMDGSDLLDRDALRIYADILKRCPTVGIVQGWLRSADTGKADAIYAANPAFPYQWLQNELEGPAFYRDEALAGSDLDQHGDGEGDWELAIDIMASGWAAVRLPMLIGDRGNRGRSEEAVPVALSRPRRTLIRRYPELFGREAPALVEILEAQSLYNKANGRMSPTREQLGSARAILRRPLRDQMTIALIALRRPVQTSHWILWRSKNIVKRQIFALRDKLLDSRR
ncbi:MAG: glycosyltransferase family 4 protein [Sphingomonadaceae bacterium]